MQRAAMSFVRHFNPRSSCEERQAGAGRPRLKPEISIHAPHARSDVDDIHIGIGIVISIHAPHARSDLLLRSPVLFSLSISIHAPHARSDVWVNMIARLDLHISIHAPHARSDTALSSYTIRFSHFNPRSSCEERRSNSISPAPPEISIHAPHARSDTTSPVSSSSPTSFQSTLLMRGATNKTLCQGFHLLFQSTLLMRGATQYLPIQHCDSIFQSTLLMRGATSYLTGSFAMYCDFNPRSSCEERRFELEFVDSISLFQSTLLMRGATSGR